MDNGDKSPAQDCSGHESPCGAGREVEITGMKNRKMDNGVNLGRWISGCKKL
jgi:hypothetical protein